MLAAESPPEKTRRIQDAARNADLSANCAISGAFAFILVVSAISKPFIPRFCAGPSVVIPVVETRVP